MKRLLWIFLLLAGGLPLFAQTPDCVIGFTFNATGQRSAITGCGHNTQGVFEWRVVYANTGFTGPLSLRLESSLNGVSWVTFAGTLNSGINPNTSLTQASTDMSGFNEYVSVALNAAAGAGTVTGVLYGCRQPGCSSVGGTVTIPTPVPVDGPTPAGSAPTTPPVLVAGQDGTPGLIRTLKTDSLGELIPSNTSAADGDGLSNTQLTPTGAAGGTLFLRVFQHVFDGVNWNRMPGNTTGVAPTNAPIANADGQSNTQATPTDVAGNPLMARVIPYAFDGNNLNRDFSCPLTATFTLAAGTDVVMIPGVAMQGFKICQIVFGADTAATMSVLSGTGVTCGTGTATVAIVGNVSGLALDPKSDGGSYNAAASGDDACFHTSVAVTGAGTVQYANF